VKLLICGLERKTARAYVQAAAAALGFSVVEAAEGDPRKSPAYDRLNWDVLLLGPEFKTKNFAGLIDRLTRERPAGFILFMTNRDDPALLAACLKAGALEALPAQADRMTIELALGRAATLLHRVDRRIYNEKLQGISQLAISINHEVNNPLMGLMGTAEMILMENHEMPEKMRRDLRTILDQAQRIQSITLRLRDLDHLRTVPYDERASMIDLLGAAEEGAESVVEAEVSESAAEASTPIPPDVFVTPRLLIVDDNRLIIDLIHRLLDSRFDIDHAVRPSEVLRKVKSTDYDLVLLDMSLPEMDGLELFRAVEQARPGQRVILTTGYDSDSRVAQAIEEGAVDWIQKPFKFENLEHRLRKALRIGRPVSKTL
jgi:DNA-binding response OmpR family regulator